MSSFNRRTLLATLAALPIAGCNFQPVYGPGGSGEIIRNRIAIAPPETRLEFELVARLEDRIGQGSAYQLTYALSSGETELAIDGAENIDRINVTGTLIFQVSETATGRVVQEGEVSTFTAYATAPSPVGHRLGPTGRSGQAGRGVGGSNDHPADRQRAKLDLSGAPT